MRFLAAIATILACLGLGWLAESGKGASLLAQAASIDKQGAGKPQRSGADTCRFAHDNECDEPDIGTGACPANTDFSDCRHLRAGEDDSCRWARDGECDEPNFGTGACAQGADRTDCGAIAWMRNRTDSCATSFNGVCEEPGRGTGCAPRSDRSDCFGRERPLTINDHFFGRDDRVRVDAQAAPWRFMGRFINGAGETCTATLIGRDVIVTAAHCIHTERGVRAEGRFLPAAGGDEARSTAYLVSPPFDYQIFSAGDEIDGLDWALLRLDRPLGDTLGFAGVSPGLAAAAPRWRWSRQAGKFVRRSRLWGAPLYQAGFSWDTGDTLSANLGCRLVSAHADGTFAHECDTTRGDSGSSFLVRGSEGFEVIGVDSNFRSNPDGPFIYIAVSAASFQPWVGDFAAGRTGAPVSAPGKRAPG